MGHGHGHGHGARAHDAGGPRRALALALALTLGFAGAEIVVGLWSGSLALLADAGHMLGDSGALAMSLVIAFIATKPRSKAKTYGYRRAEVLGALLNALALVAIVLWIVMEAIGRLESPPEVRGVGMLGTAALGLGVNIAAAWILATRGGGGINVRGALLHVIGDALGSVAAIVAGLFIVFAGWRLADPIASLVIALLICYGALRLLRETTHVLMEGTPQGLDVHDLEATILETPGVADVHDLHVWALTPGEPMLTAHVVIERGTHGTQVVKHVGDRLRRYHGVDHVTIQPEAPEGVLVELRVPKQAG